MSLHDLLRPVSSLKDWKPLPAEKAPRRRIKSVLATRPRQTGAQILKNRRDARLALHFKHIESGLRQSLSIRKIADGTSLSHDTIRRYISLNPKLQKLLTKEVEKAPAALFQQNKELVREMLTKKRGLREIGAAIGISASTVSRLTSQDKELRELGGPRIRSQKS